ncbi:hypothetical protein M9458_046061, partial [Cirrhinus mrigala]
MHAHPIMDGTGRIKPAERRAATSRQDKSTGIIKTKEVQSKKPKRGASATPNTGKKEMKPDNRCKSSGRRKLSDGSITSDDLSKDSGCATGKLSSTDSSSEISDASEEHKQSTDAEGTDEEIMDDSAEQISEHREEDGLINATLSPGISPGDQSRLNLSSSVAFSDLTGDFADGVHEDLLREIDDLRSENEYLK